MESAISNDDTDGGRLDVDVADKTSDLVCRHVGVHHFSWDRSRRTISWWSLNE